MTKVRGIRGATTADDNTKEAILDATRELLENLVNTNGVVIDDIAAVTLTTTRDLNATFPAVAARKYLGWDDVALICGHEMNVPDAQPRCIRVLMLVNTDKSPREIMEMPNSTSTPAFRNSRRIEWCVNRTNRD